MSTESSSSKFCTRAGRYPPAAVTGRFLLAATFVVLLFSSGAGVAQFANLEQAPDFDIRGARPVTLPEPPAALPPARAQALAGLRSEAVTDQLTVLWSGLTGAPSRIHARGRPMLPAQAASPRGIAMAFLDRHRLLFGLSPEDIREMTLSRDYVTERNGVTHLTLQQQAFGYDVFGGGIKINVSFRGEIINVSGEPIPGIHAAVNTVSPQMTEQQAVERGARNSGIAEVADSSVLGLILFPRTADDVRLAWHLNIADTDSPNGYEVLVDAVDGDLLFRRSLTHYGHIPARGEVYDSDAPLPYTPNETISTSPVARVERPFTGGDFFPHDDPHWDWWATQPRSTTTSNNVDAYADRDGDNAADTDSRPAPSGDEDFTFPLDLTQDPSQYQDASVVNLFYWNNRIHDWFYRMGFDEQAGNFQADNFSLGGSGGDPVRAETQDNAAPTDPDADRSLCNANMWTPGDGSAPRMQMFVCDRDTPERDGSLDAVVIGHEYTHGVHARLVPTAGNQRANEGWADFFGLALVAEPGDAYDGSYGVGDYLFDNSGIRSAPYSTRLDMYPRRYADINDIASCATKICSNDSTQSCNNNADCGGESDTCYAISCKFHEDCDSPPNDIDLGLCRVGVHRTGEIWANALWIARMHLVAKLGFSAGDRRMNQLVIDGMKLSPDNPTYLDGRDAILMADFQNHGGAHACLIWDAFAKMGMGYSAMTAGFEDINPLQAFDMPAECAPKLQFNSDREFGSVCLADTSTRPLQVFNQGNGDLIVADISRISGSSQIKLEQAPEQPVFVAAGSHVDFTVRCSPTSGGTKTATFRVTSNDENSPHDIVYTCSGGEAEITTTMEQNYGDVCLADSLIHELRISNPGTCDLGIDNITSNDLEFAIAQVMDFPLKVSPGGEVTVPIRFSPEGDFGAENASISISHDAADTSTPKTLTVSGNSPPGSLNTALANEGSFGNVCKADHADLNLTLFNQGQCNLTIDSVGINQPGSSFELPADTTFPLVLSPDADFNLPIRYAPAECNDETENATVVVATDDPLKENFEIGISGVSRCPNLVIDPAGLENLFSFPATVVDSEGTLGCFSDATVALRNSGECPLTIDGVSASGDDFAVTAPTQFPILLPPGEETLGVNVRFTPQADSDPLAPDEVLGSLSIVSDDPDAAGTADLCGESTAQSGVRILVTDITTGLPMMVDPVERIDLSSKGINRPGPIKLTFTDAVLHTSTVCGNIVQYHVNQETLPSTDNAGGAGNNASYESKARHGNLQAADTFTLGQCEFRDVQLQLQASESDPGDPGMCLLLDKGEACTTDGECCSGKCRGPAGDMTCR
ncbi:MAG: M36 family metallopeptidase [Wenzhouxiangellaceae bacterium]|nr:M36 family metallopeptidase [Wenzhouxiangellaceae bacterium]